MIVAELFTDVETITVLSIIRTAILLLGGFVTFTAYRAYRRTENRSLLLLSLGFGAVTLGTFLAGVGYNLGMTLAQGILLESTLVLIGFAIIAYSLFDRG